MVLAAPMAGWMRGMILNAPILPLFVIILGGVSALGMLVWRGLFAIIMGRLKSKDG
jgi:ABC-type xylose transport system permease subunit